MTSRGHSTGGSVSPFDEAEFLRNDPFRDRYTAAAGDRHTMGPLFRWDWGQPNDIRDQFWATRIAWIYEVGADSICPPLPPPPRSQCEALLRDLRVKAVRYYDLKARDTLNTISNASARLVAQQAGFPVACQQSRDEYILREATMLYDIRSQYALAQSRRKSQQSSSVSGSSRGTSNGSTTPDFATRLSRYAEAQIYAEYQQLLRRRDPVTAAIFAKKANTMGGSTSPATRRWSEAEGAWHRRVFAEQARWIIGNPQTWAVPESSNGHRTLPGSSNLVPIPDLVPGFIPPPGWSITLGQFTGLQNQGLIAKDALFTGYMPASAIVTADPNDEHRTMTPSGASLRLFGFSSMSAEAEDGAQTPTPGGRLSADGITPLRRTSDPTDPEDERFSPVGLDWIPGVQSSVEGSRSSLETQH